MLVPTGIHCAVGGHAGDATPAARLLASVCDNLILHPNVVKRLMLIPAFRARCIESHSYVQTLRQLRASTPPAQEAAEPRLRRPPV